jgi:hypothetical protein
MGKGRQRLTAAAPLFFLVKFFTYLEFARYTVAFDS